MRNYRLPPFGAEVKPVRWPMSVPGGLYVIERRHEDGTLDLRGKQPESVFGMDAIHGISADRMAKVVFAHMPDNVELHGENVSTWPSLIDPRWVARVRYW